MAIKPDHHSMVVPEKFFRLAASGITEWVNGRPCDDPQAWQVVIAELLNAANTLATEARR